MCLEAASTWLNECLTNHTACSRAAPDNLPNLPTRVIDVGTDSISPQLIITNGRCGDYVALSYCWGGNSDFVLNTDRLPILQAGIPLVEWPKTLRDAIVVTRSLKIQYIWIDALCIQQDSKEDWSREASKMRDVYAQSLLTVSASRSPSTTFGIFSERDAKTDHCWINVGSENSKNKVYLRLGSELWDDTLRSSPLSGRGWTLQEGLLAPRTLSYGSQQMVWECSTHQVDEGGRSTLPTQDYKDKQSMQKMIKAGSTNKHKISKYIGDSLYSRVKNISHSPFAKQDSINTSDSYDRWYEVSILQYLANSLNLLLMCYSQIVQEFTTRSLTFVTDTLPAVSGIAQAFAPSLPPSTFSSQYIAGIWTGDIIGILWRRSIRHKVLDTNFTPEYLGPSWSWASLRDGLALASVVKQQRTALSLNWARDIAKVVGFEVELQSKDPFGCVSNGVMIIRGRFKVLSKCPSSLLSTLVQPMTAQTEKSKNSSELDLSPIERYLDESLVGDDKYEFLQKHREVSGQKFALLEIIRWKKASDTQEPGMDMLLLETADTKETEWRRIAMISVRKWLTRSANEQLSRTEMAQNEAFEDIMRGDWKKMTVRIV